ncbi:HDOD domain-containing protein [bacterium]|nr:HDOD domain-containing protein [bacterium]
MKNILLVDDEPNVLSGLKRMLYPMHSIWNVQTAESGKLALEKMISIPFDVLITDMRMPEMNGLELLTQVKERYPDIIRIVLSGHSDREIILKSVNIVHQYLSKPCSADTIKTTIERVLAIKNLLQSSKIRTVVSSLQQLPSLPELYTNIMAEIQKDEPSINVVAEIISEDISMSAKVLQLVNSAFFSLPRHISSIQNAVNLLGLETISSLVLSIKIFSQFDNKSFDFFPIHRLWSHSLRVANFSKYISSKILENPIISDYTFISGMMHDIGRLLLVTNFPEEYKKIIQPAEKNFDLICSIEQKELGVTHSGVGAYLLGIWGFPYPVIEAVAFHHTPLQSKDSSLSPLSFVYITDLLDNMNQYKTEFKPNAEYLKMINLKSNLTNFKNEYKNFLLRKDDRQ